jgi:hypothetical protein
MFISLFSIISMGEGAKNFRKYWVQHQAVDCRYLEKLGERLGQDIEND